MFDKLISSVVSYGAMGLGMELKGKGKFGEIAE